MTIDKFLPDEETRVRLRELPDDGPVVMLNLLEFVAGGELFYGAYGRTALPQILKRGGRILYSGVSVFDDPKAGHWDRLILVEYPSRAAFLDMMADPEYQRGLPHREAALKRTELYAFQPSNEPGAPPLQSVATEGGDEIFVLNLLRFKAERGRENYQKYSRVSMPMILECGGSLILVLE